MSLFPTTPQQSFEALRSDRDAVRRQAMHVLAAVYRRPLVAYARARWSMRPEDAADAAHDFFVHALEHGTFAAYTAQHARFRSFVSVCFNHFVVSEARRRGSRKNGGGEPSTSLESAGADAGAPQLPSPEDLYEREWRRQFFTDVLARLEAHCRSKNKGEHFDLFYRYYVDGDEEQMSYAAVGSELGMGETTVTNRLSYARAAFRKLALATLRELSVSQADFERDARDLLSVGP